MTAERSRTMKIFLAGASGVIGRSLVPRLTGAGHDVTGMTGDSAAAGLVRSLGARPVVVDVLDRDRLAEALVALEATVSEAPHGVLLRYGTLYGPGTGYASDGTIAAQVRRGELPATEDVTSFLHVEDAVDAAVQALGWPAGPVNIVDDEPAPGLDWLPVYAAAVGAGVPPGKQPGTGSGLRGATNSKARKDYGWEPIHPSWREGFRTALG
jgi:nucleoside-diphosphate-sugar epimerase